jgi:hypothetical protein
MAQHKIGSKQACRQRWGRPAAWRRVWVFALVCGIFGRVVHAGVSVTPVASPKLLIVDNFDTKNVVGTAPANWSISALEGTTVRVVDASVTEPFSPPYCVELVDNSPKGRAEMYRDFSPSSTGQASAVFKLKSIATAHAVLQLRTARGAHLCSVIFASGGLMRYEGQGGGVNTTTAWKPGEWQKIQIEWFADSTFNASLGDTPFAQRVHFVADGIPSRVHVVVGYSTAVNKIGYVDDVRVVGVGAGSLE